ncbi:MAG: PA14 domain-containing protein, partial [Phycisphaerales bacterium]
NLTSANAVPVLSMDDNPGAWGHVVIDGGSLTGGALTNDALINEQSAGVLTVRNVTTSGYRFAINDLSFGPANARTVPNGPVSQYTTDPPVTLNPSPSVMLGLQGADTPAIPQIPVAQWVSVKSYGAIEDDNLDDTAAIQSALLSGAPVVYFPTGTYRVAQTLVVGPAVEVIEGYNSSIAQNAPLAVERGALLQIPAGSQPIVHIRGLNSSFSIPGRSNAVFIEQQTANTVVVADGDISYRNTRSGGKVHLENVVGTDMTFSGQRVWASQLNPEGNSAHVVNNAGDLYALGVKTEGNGSVLVTQGRGRSLILGGLVYPSTTIPDRTRAMFTNIESSLSMSMPESCYIPDGSFAVWVRETRAGITTELTRGMLPLGRTHANCGGMLNFFNGYELDPTTPTVPGAPALASATENSIEINWAPAVDAESGVARHNITRDGVFLQSTLSPTLRDEGLRDGTSHTYEISAINGAGVESPRSQARTFATFADTASPRLISAAMGLDPRFLTVGFAEAVEAASATTLANYSVRGATVLAAQLSTDGQSVTLTTTPINPGDVEVSVSNVRDLAHTPNAVLPATTIVARYAATSNGTGLTGTYFASREFVGTPLLTRVDPIVNFNWNSSSPAPQVPQFNYAVRWVGQLQPRFTEAHTLIVRADDGARLFVDGVLLADRWQDQGPTDVGGTIMLDSSRTHDVVIEYYQGGGGASVEFSWQSPSQPRQIVPTACLFPQPRLRTIRTFDGAGADAGLDRYSTDDFGTGDSVGAFHSPAAGGFHQAGYLRFDLGSLNLAQNFIAEATATLSQTYFGVGDGKREINFFGVRQGANGDNWIESGAGHVTWNTAVGNDASGGLGDPDTTRFLATVFLDNTGFQNNNRPDKLWFTGERLRNFLREDTDGKVTFLFKRVDASNEGQSFFTKEWSSPSFAPSLRVRVISKCPRVLQDPIVPGTVDPGDALTLSIRAEGEGPLSYQWLRSGSPVSDGAQCQGATTPALTILSAGPSDSGEYVCVVTNACGQAASASVIIRVCAADFNQDGGVDGDDVIAFFTAWDAGELVADFNADGGVDGDDVIQFFARWDQGC